MFSIYRSMPYLASCVTLSMLFAASGCQSTPNQVGPQPVQTAMPVQNVMPRELSKVILPPYTIEPPDILVIDEVYAVPPPSYELRPSDTLSVQVQRRPSDPLRPGDMLQIEVAGFPSQVSVGDVLTIQVEGVPQDAPISGPFQVEGNGQVRLVVPRFEETVELDATGRESLRRVVAGMRDYGSVTVEGLTIQKAEEAIETELRKTWANVDVWATFAQTTAQPIQGPYLVLPGGDLFFGLPYCRVHVAGKTLDEAEEAIRSSVGQVLSEPTVCVTLDTFTATPIGGYYTIQPDGKIDLIVPSGGGTAQTAGGALGGGAEMRPGSGA
jgi:protein involved in polysaccharide export with SLBB domain